MLLADVFERFINTCLKNYGLDPCHDLSSPGLSRYVMLKMAEIELELIADNDMHLFIEKKMRGGISYIAKRYSKANTKDMKSYNVNESNLLCILDANNLYDWAMSRFLPYSGFE